MSGHAERPSDAVVRNELPRPLRYRLKSRRKRQHQLPVSFLGKFGERCKIARAYAGRLLGEYMGIVFESDPDGRRGEP